MSQELRREVAAFAGEMEARLRANEHKGGWQDCASNELLVMLLKEVSELAEALYWRASSNEVRREAADVANFAMMIADPERKALPGDER